MVINAAWAEQMFGDRDAVGRRIVDTDFESGACTVIGVVEDAKLAGPVGGLGDYFMFLPQESYAVFSLIVRTSDDPRPLIGDIKREI